tara:strand:- start:438 stop:869 length:432 start_codon:yes stop_codon:yes gene_type:complete
MNAAIIEAKKALKINEVPIGAVLVDNQTNKIIFRNYNKINTLNNAIKHCEINLINDACEKLKQKYLENMTMFVTLEPCSMCTSAISEVHIGALYFGAYDEKNGGIEKIRTTFQRNNIFMPNIYGGILEDDCSILLKKFFSNKR